MTDYKKSIKIQLLLSTLNLKNAGKSHLDHALKVYRLRCMKQSAHLEPIRKELEEIGAKMEVIKASIHRDDVDVLDAELDQLEVDLFKITSKYRQTKKVNTVIYPNLWIWHTFEEKVGDFLSLLGSIIHFFSRKIVLKSST